MAGAAASRRSLPDRGDVVRSSNRVYLPAVDHLRAAAAVLVVLFHGSQLLRSPVPGPPSFSPSEWSYSVNPLETLISEGHTGVALFMVLSGFILTTGALGRDIRYGTFIRNRLLRVGPLFVVVLLVAVAAASASFSFLGLLQTVFGFATLPGGFTTGPFAMILWTVGIEVQFYLLFPLFLRILDNRGPRPLVLFVLCMAVFRTLAALTTSGVDLHQLTYFSIAGRIDQFLIGMLAAWLFPRIRAPGGPHGVRRSGGSGGADRAVVVQPGARDRRAARLANGVGGRRGMRVGPGDPDVRLDTPLRSRSGQRRSRLGG